LKFGNKDYGNRDVTLKMNITVDENRV